MTETLILFALFLIVALVYSIAGLGGGSTYVALLFIMGTPLDLLPKVALVCNLIVVTGGSFQFVRAGHFTPRVFIPFVVTSIPVALWTGTLDLSEYWFMVTLAVVLLLAGLRLLLTPHLEGRPMEELRLRNVWLVGLPMGAVLGAIAGIIGIGGGIFLAPLLSVLQWGNARQIAATASGFVMVTSVAALMGHLIATDDYIPFGSYYHLYGAVFIGGLIGSRLGAVTMPVVAMRAITALLALGVSATLFFQIFQGFLTK